MKTRDRATFLGILTLSAAALYACSAGDNSTTSPRARQDGGGAGQNAGAEGGRANVGGGSSNAAGGSSNASGGGSNGGSAGSIIGGGGSNSGGGSIIGCPIPEPKWSAPSVPSPTVCAGAAPPPVKKWLDDFEGHTFDPTLSGWNIAADTTNGKCVVPQGGGAASTISLSPWGTHDESTQNGLRLHAYMGCLAPEGSNNWGAQWQFQTEPKKTGRAVLDLSSYAGIVIWARLAGAPGKGNMTAAFMTPQTTPGDAGGDGTCGTAASPALCFGYYNAAAKVSQPCWAPIVVDFSDLKPLGPAPVSGFDQAHVLGLQLAVSAWDTAAKANFPVDILIDDIYLY